MIRMYSSSPPPLDEEEDSDFGDFGDFSGVPNSISLSEFDTPTTFNQSQALAATSPPELVNSRGVAGFGHNNELAKANGVPPASHLGGGPSERTEMKRVLSASGRAGGEPADCNGGGAEVLTNGFATSDIQGSPSSQNFVRSRFKGASGEDGVPDGSPEDEFADFAAFSNAEGHAAAADSDGGAEHCNTAQGTTSEDSVRDWNRTGSISVPAEAADASCDADRDADSQRDVASDVCTNCPVALNGADVADADGPKDAAGCGEDDPTPGQSDGKGSGNDTETETETETSFGRPLSTDALEEYGDMSTTGSVPSPPLQGETATPADHSQLAEDDEDEDFGDFGDAGSFGGHGFADFEQLDVQQEQSRSQSSAPQQEAPDSKDDDFGDFNSPKRHGGGHEGEEGGAFADFTPSDSFGNFSSAGAGGEADAG